MPVHYLQDVSGVPNRVIQGFTGSGMVASLALYHLFDAFQFTQIGYLTFDELPAMAVVKEGTIMHPVRIYASDTMGYAVVCDIPLPEDVVPLAVDELLDWYQQKGIEQVIVIGGLPTGREIKDEKVKVKTVLNGIEMPYGDHSKLSLMEKGGTYGSIALTLLRTKEMRIPAMALLAECIPNVPDYGAAVALLENLAAFLSLEIDTEDLTKNASELKKKLLDEIPRMNGNSSNTSSSYT